MEEKTYKHLVVGADLSGLILATKLSSTEPNSVVVLDYRSVPFEKDLTPLLLLKKDSYPVFEQIFANKNSFDKNIFIYSQGAWQEAQTFDWSLPKNFNVAVDFEKFSDLQKQFLSQSLVEFDTIVEAEDLPYSLCLGSAISRIQRGEDSLWRVESAKGNFLVENVYWILKEAPAENIVEANNFDIKVNDYADKQAVGGMACNFTFPVDNFLEALPEGQANLLAIPMRAKDKMYFIFVSLNRGEKEIFCKTLCLLPEEVCEDNKQLLSLKKSFVRVLKNSLVKELKLKDCRWIFSKNFAQYRKPKQQLVCPGQSTFFAFQDPLEALERQFFDVK